MFGFQASVSNCSVYRSTARVWKFRHSSKIAKAATFRISYPRDIFFIQFPKLHTYIISMFFLFPCFFYFRVFLLISMFAHRWCQLWIFQPPYAAARTQTRVSWRVAPLKGTFESFEWTLYRLSNLDHGKAK